MPPVKDHLGNEYPSKRAMCGAYGMPLSTYGNRLNRGWTVEQALTVPRESNAPKVNHKKIWKDHLGNEYVSVNDMCSRYGISEKVFWSRKRILKWPLEKILTTPLQTNAGNAIKTKDHLGNEFDSICAMCDHYHVGWSTYRERRKLGWTVEEALSPETKPVSIERVECEDHLGNRYPSLNAMCRAYGLTRHRYSSRIKMGWPMERALTEPYVVNNKSFTDPAGREFPTMRDVANWYALPKYAFQGNAFDEGGFAELLETKIRSRFYGVVIAGLRIDRCVGFPYFLVDDHGYKCVLHYESVLDAYHDSAEFDPVPKTDANAGQIRVVKRLSFPYYLAEIGQADEPEVYSYWELIRINAESNFGLKKDNKI